MSKIGNVIEAVKLLQNWPLYFADRLRLVRGRYIVYVLRDGTRYRLRPNGMDRIILHEVWVRKIYTPSGFEVRDNSVVVDIGAQVGMFTIFAAKQAGNGKVYAFEPEPENFELLRQNIELNGAANVIPAKKAVSERKGRATLFICKDNSGGHSLYGAENGAKIEVQTVSLKDIFEDNGLAKIDFLKMDCEGAEYGILLNCPDSILGRISRISMEYHNIDNKKNVSSLKKFLAGKGFEVKTKAFDDIVGMIYAKR